MSAVYSYLPIMQRAAPKAAHKGTSSKVKDTDKASKAAIREISKSTSKAPETLQGRVSTGWGQFFQNLFARLWERAFSKPVEPKPVFISTPVVDQTPKTTDHEDGLSQLKAYIDFSDKSFTSQTINKKVYSIHKNFVTDIDRDMGLLHIGKDSFYEMNKKEADLTQKLRDGLKPKIRELEDLRKDPGTGTLAGIYDCDNSLQEDFQKNLLDNQLQSISDQLKEKRRHLLPQITALMNQNSMIFSAKLLAERYPYSSDPSSNKRKIQLDIPENEDEPVTIKITLQQTYIKENPVLRESSEIWTQQLDTSPKIFERPIVGSIESTFTLSGSKEAPVVRLKTRTE